MQAGASSWTVCQSHEREATRRLRGAGLSSDIDRRRLRELHAWGDACPHAPAVLVLTAALELVLLPEPSSDDLLAGLDELDRDLSTQRRRALRRLRGAVVESARRGEAPPSPAHYLIAYASLGLGDLAGAQAAVTASRARAEVEIWRLDRMEAFVALFRGDLPEALRLAHRSLEYATGSGRMSSMYTLAMALDRAGSITASRRILAQIRVREGRDHAALDSLLPLHERLYLMAIEQEARGYEAAAKRLWTHYLERPEVEAPERALAERRLATLGGGPAVAGP